MRPTSQVLELAEAMRCAQPELDTEDQRIAISRYGQLATGRPVPAIDIAVASIDRVEKGLGGWPAVFRDGEESVIGFWGLTVVEMGPHQILAEGVRLWAWCALFPAPEAGEAWVNHHQALQDAFDLARISNRRFAIALDDPRFSGAAARR